MGVKTATVTLDGEGLRFVGTTGSGHRAVLDSGEGDTGMRPAELVPLALAGCTSMDVISILRKKRQAVTAYRVEAIGTQLEGHPAPFVRIDLTHVLEGVDLDAEAVRRSIELSATQYCNVGATLSTGITEIHHRYLIHDPVEGDREAEVVVIGPRGAIRVVEPALATAGS